MDRVKINHLSIDAKLADLINNQVLAELNLKPKDYWSKFESLLNKFSGQNDDLLKKREQMQLQINTWLENNQQSFNQDNYNQFLTQIGYLQPQPEDFQITSSNIDQEISQIAAAQLVVPVNNARYALNAVNARFGSLYDALYGTNALFAVGSNDDKKRAIGVINFVRDFLDECFALEKSSHKNAIKYWINNHKLVVELENGEQTELKNPQHWQGLIGQTDQPKSIILKRNNLHLILDFDINHPIGKIDKAHIKDIRIESAVSTIMDCEDSVAAVDGEDKSLVYANWFGLMKGDLTATFSKNNQVIERKINDDITYLDSHLKPAKLRNTSLLLVRNVGHLTKTAAVLYQGKEVYEGLLDGFITSCIAKINLENKARFENSAQKSIYIVKPKMHGPQEVAFANAVFDEIEKLLGLKAKTIKIGVMDEERRTSVNLKACIKAVKDRICFINTGFLDRTGDEIHTHMRFAPVPFKADFKKSPWMLAYEKSNVITGLKMGFLAKAQIGKGMWAQADNMKQMLEQKIDHLLAGGSCAWVPSPTAASLHAMHYFKINVQDIQKQLLNESSINREKILEVATLNQIPDGNLLQKELENNCQGILGYVVRWINQGIGCSKVPDLNSVALMEDRATLRISSQHIANWYFHGLLNQNQIESTLRKMAILVDEQNKQDKDYQNMAPNFDQSIAFNAARDLIFLGKNQPNGYTELLLQQKRIAKKASC